MLHFQLISPTGTTIEVDVFEVVLPTAAGTIGVLDGHEPLVGALVPGVIQVFSSSNSSSPEEYATIGGLVEVDGHNLSVLTDEITQASDIKEEEAQAAIDSAKEVLQKATSRHSLEVAQQQLAYSTLRLNIARMKKRRHN